MGNNQPTPDAFEFAKRLHECLDAMPDVPARTERGRGAWLATALKVSQPTAHSWLKGDFMPKPERVRAIAAKANVSYDWLYFGEGAPTDQAPSESPSPKPAPDASQSVRRSTLTLALQLAAEALGSDLYLPPAQHAEFVILLCDLIEDGLPEAQVLQVARRAANAFQPRGDDGSDGTSGEAARNTA